MTPEPGKQTITMNVLPNIAHYKGNQTMKFGELIGNIFLKESCRKWGRETSPRPLFSFFKETLYETKVSGLRL